MGVPAISTKEKGENIFEKEWSKIQNLVMFSEKYVKLPDDDSGKSCEKEITKVSGNMNALQNAIAKGDSVQVQKLIITIIETIVIMIEMIEYRVTVIRKTENATERGKLSKSLEDELIFLTENIKILRESANISSILNSQLSKLVTESINKIETQVIYVEKDLKTEVEKVEIENITVDPCDETIPKDNADKAKEEKKDKQPAFNLPIPEHANDFMEVIEGGGFTLDDEEEDENPKIENLDNKISETAGISKESNQQKIFDEEWSKIQNLVMFTENRLQHTKSFTKESCDDEIKSVRENFETLQNAFEKGDSVQAQKIIITIIETIIIIIEIIETRISAIQDIKNDSEREKECKALENELLFITKHLTILKECANTSSILDQQLIDLATDSVCRIESQVVNVERIWEAEAKKVENEILKNDKQPNIIEKEDSISEIKKVIENVEPKLLESSGNVNDLGHVSKTTIRKRIVKKIVDGKPIVTEEIIEEPDDVLTSSNDTVTTNVTTIRKILRKKIVRKIVIIDGKPIETEEVIEEPIEILEGEEIRIDEPTEQLEEVATLAQKPGTVEVVQKTPVSSEYDVKLNSGEGANNIEVLSKKEETFSSIPQHENKSDSLPSLPNENVTEKLIRHRIIKKIVMVEGKPVETEITESPIENTEGSDTQCNEEENVDNARYDEKIIRKRIIKRIVMEDGKPIETEQIIEDPEMLDDTKESGSVPQDNTQRIIRTKIIKKI